MRASRKLLLIKPFQRINSALSFAVLTFAPQPSLRTDHPSKALQAPPPQLLRLPRPGKPSSRSTKYKGDVFRGVAASSRPPPLLRPAAKAKSPRTSKTKAAKAARINRTYRHSGRRLLVRARETAHSFNFGQRGWNAEADPVLPCSFWVSAMRIRTPKSPGCGYRLGGLVAPYAPCLRPSMSVTTKPQVPSRSSDGCDSTKDWSVSLSGTLWLGK
ncbi:hypothetical protein C8R44DRAFT_744630 [Mycena epipterygia]|nr:hypothetical protein C8R44DRAFT_744630 [Mycena epipterygia]